MHHLIELWSPKAKWLEMSATDRQDYLAGVAKGIAGFLQEGLQLHATGMAGSDLANSVPYRFFLVWDSPSKELIDRFMTELERLNWFKHFDQVNTAGDNIGLEALLEAHIKLP